MKANGSRHPLGSLLPAFTRLAPHLSEMDAPDRAVKEKDVGKRVGPLGSRQRAEWQFSGGRLMESPSFSEGKAGRSFVSREHSPQNRARR